MTKDQLSNIKKYYNQCRDAQFGRLYIDMVSIVWGRFYAGLNIKSTTSAFLNIFLVIFLISLTVNDFRIFS